MRSSQITIAKYSVTHSKANRVLNDLAEGPLSITVIKKPSPGAIEVKQKEYQVKRAMVGITWKGGSTTQLARNPLRSKDPTEMHETSTKNSKGASKTNTTVVPIVMRGTQGEQ